MQHFISRMDDKSAKEQKSRVNKVVDKWLKPMGMAWWDITFEFVQEIHECEDGGNWVTQMTCRTDWTRMRATISVNLSAVREMSDEILEETILHELMHVVVRELAACADRSTPEKRDDADCHEERVVQSLAKHMIWAVKNVKR